MPNDRAGSLAGLDVRQAAKVMALGQQVHLPSGGALFRLGDEAGRLFLVERGRIALTLPMKVGDGEGDVLVEEMLPGQIFGWSGLVPPHRFTLNATAPLATDLLAFQREALAECFAEDPRAGYLLMRNVAAVIGARLHVFQAMWLREMQRTVAARAG